MKIKDRKFLNVITHSCHASSIVFYKGKPVFSWFGGTREGLPDCAIYIQYDDQVVNLGAHDQWPRWNPILFTLEDKLYLFSKVGSFCDRWQTIVNDISNIFDGALGKTSFLPAGLNGPVKTKPIFHKGFIYCGSSVETEYDWTSYIEKYKVVKGEFSFCERTSPIVVPKRFYTDYYGKKAFSRGIIQPSLWIDDDNLHALFRSSNGLKNAFYLKSHIDKIFKIKGNINPVETQIPNPNSSLDTIFSDGRLFMVYNPSSFNRYPLSVVELDKNFEKKEELIVNDNVDGLADIFGSREFSYPYMIKHENEIHLVYTYGRKKIEYVIIEV